MSVHKVPQDVEADDKLLGPFSFRQFIYLIIAVMGIAAAWGLSRILVPLFVIPLPIVVFFGALALPLRKDQPMETYLAAMVSFYLKPRRRLWDPDGTVSLVEITAPATDDIRRTKDLDQAEASRRLSYLADIVDTQGWSVRGVNAPVSTAMTTDAYLEAQATEDVLDQAAPVSQSFDHLIEQNDARHRQEMLARIQQQTTTPIQQDQLTIPAPSIAVQPPVNPYDTFLQATPTPQPQTQPSSLSAVTFDPYPSSMHQHVLQPLSAQPQEKLQPNTPNQTVMQQAAPQQPPQLTAQPTQTVASKPIKPSAPVVSPGIINLANNPDLSIETIAREANRIKQKETASLPDDEVVISLR